MLINLSTFGLSVVGLLICVLLFNTFTIFKLLMILKRQSLLIDEQGEALEMSLNFFRAAAYQIEFSVMNLKTTIHQRADEHVKMN